MHCSIYRNWFRPKRNLWRNISQLIPNQADIYSVADNQNKTFVIKFIEYFIFQLALKLFGNSLHDHNFIILNIETKVNKLMPKSTNPMNQHITIIGSNFCIKYYLILKIISLRPLPVPLAKKIICFIKKNQSLAE